MGAIIYELMVYFTVFIFLLPVIFWKKIDTGNGISQLLIKLFEGGMAAVCEEIFALEVFQEMSCYPDDGSIRIIDDIIVIKIINY